MADWYVSFIDRPGVTIMRVAKNRDAALALACDLLRQGVNVQEVGPTLDILDGNVIPAAELRKICAGRPKP